MSIQISPGFIATCKEKLLTAKADLLNRYRTHTSEFRERELMSGDEADQTMAIQAENNLYVAQRRLREQIFEIEAALGRIERGSYGICEDTGEPIEPNRLLAIPWTRFSLEAAEKLSRSL